VNKVTGPLEILKKDIDSSGIPLAGTISYSEELMNLGLEGRSISELEDEKVASSIEAITKKILD
jgi:CO dehydrogenase nickel-insertion accessory protein CooC1